VHKSITPARASVDTPTYATPSRYPQAHHKCHTLVPHGRPQDADLLVTWYTEAQRRCARSSISQRNDVRQDIGYRERGLYSYRAR